MLMNYSHIFGSLACRVNDNNTDIIPNLTTPIKFDISSITIHFIFNLSSLIKASFSNEFKPNDMKEVVW